MMNFCGTTVIIVQKKRCETQQNFTLFLNVWIQYLEWILKFGIYVNAGLFFDHKVILNVLEVTLFMRMLKEFIAAKPNRWLF